MVNHRTKWSMASISFHSPVSYLGVPNLGQACDFGWRTSNPDGALKDAAKYKEPRRFPDFHCKPGEFSQIVAMRHNPARWFLMPKWK